MKTATKSTLILVIFFAIAIVPSLGKAADYVISDSADFTGPYAVMMKSVDAARKIFCQWWNDTRGSALGITLHRKTYETRYDSSIVASLWPKILASDKPIAHLGMGISDVTALMTRLPSDKVPMFNGNAASRVLWSPNQWVFQFHPTYTHETAAFLGWAHKNFIKNRPVRFGAFEYKVPGGVEVNEGHIKLAKERDWVQFLGAEWVDPKPITVVSELRRMLKNKPDYIRIAGSTGQVIAVIKAQKELGVHIPLIMSYHNGIQMSSKAMGDMNFLDGHYDSYAGDTATDLTLAGARIFEEYRNKLGITATWDMAACHNGIAMLLALRAIERAAAKVGANNITGETVYNAMFEGAFTKETMLGLTSNLAWTKEASFPLTGLKISISTVKNGKQVLISDDIPVPDVPKW